MFEIYCVKRSDVVSTMSNFKKWLIQYVNKINRRCSAHNEKIYYWLQIALVYASFGCRIYGLPDPLARAPLSYSLHPLVFSHSPTTYVFQNHSRPWSRRPFFRVTVWLKDRRHIDGPLGPLKFPAPFGLSALRLSRNIVYGSPDIS